MNIRISKQELRSHGCTNCIWKIHNQCPHNLKGEESHKDYICKDYLEFILSFAEEDDSVNAMWEKFSLYISRLQSLEDYKTYLSMKEEIDTLKKGKTLDYREDMQYDIKLNTLRLWWERLNDTVRKGYGRIADREEKKKEGGKVAGIHNAGTINFNIGDENKPTKVIESKATGKLEDKSK